MAEAIVQEIDYRAEAHRLSAELTLADVRVATAAANGAADMRARAAEALRARAQSLRARDPLSYAAAIVVLAEAAEIVESLS